MVAGRIQLVKGWVYRLEHKTNKKLKFYIGSCIKMNRRWKCHIYNCNTPFSFKKDKNGKKIKIMNEKYDFEVYKYIRENGGIDNWKMKCLLLNKTQKFQVIESEIIKITWLDNTNGNIPGRQKKDWYQDNKDDQQKKKAVVHICNHCFRHYTVAHKKRHERSKYCRQFQE